MSPFAWSLLQRKSTKIVNQLYKNDSAVTLLQHWEKGLDIRAKEGFLFISTVKRIEHLAEVLEFQNYIRSASVSKQKHQMK